MEKPLYALAAAVIVAALSVTQTFGKEAKMATPAQKVYTDAEIKAREADILNHPQRIAPLKQEEIGAEAKQSIDDVRKAVNKPPLDKVPDFIATMVRHPSLYKAHMVLAMQLFNGALKIREREIAILRIGWLCQAPFEFGEHVGIGKSLGGLTDQEVKDIIVGSSAPGWKDADRALIRAVEELHSDAMISDATWATLAKYFDDKQLIELPVLVGQYQGVAYVQNSLRIPLMAGGKGLEAR